MQRDKSHSMTIIHHETFTDSVHTSISAQNTELLLVFPLRNGRLCNI